MFKVKVVYLTFIKPYLKHALDFSNEEKQKMLLELLINITRDLGMNLNEFLEYSRSSLDRTRNNQQSK